MDLKTQSDGYWPAAKTSMVEFPKGVLIFWMGLVLFAALYEGTWFSPSLYEWIFAVGYRYESTSGYVEEQERLIEIQKNGGEKEEALNDHDELVEVGYTSVAEAKKLQHETRADTLAALRNPPQRKIPGKPNLSEMSPILSPLDKLSPSTVSNISP